MRKSKKVDHRVYRPQTISDTVATEIEKLSKQTRDREYQERIADIAKIHKEKSDLINNIKEDKKTYTINTIIEFAEAGKRTIPYSYFPYHITEQQLFNIFLNKLLTSGGISAYSINPFKEAYHSEYIFDGINISLLQQSITTSSILQFQPGQTVIYDKQKKSLYFKTGDGSLPEIIDFFSAPAEYKLFECFWNLRSANPNKTEFTRAEIQQMYGKIHKANISSEKVSPTVGNINKRVRSKTSLVERFILCFNKSKNVWNFLVS